MKKSESLRVYQTFNYCQDCIKPSLNITARVLQNDTQRAFRV